MCRDSEVRVDELDFRHFHSIVVLSCCRVLGWRERGSFMTELDDVAGGGGVCLVCDSDLRDRDRQTRFMLLWLECYYGTADLPGLGGSDTLAIILPSPFLPGTGW